MSKVKIVYWSGTGNTKMMAEAIEKGVKASEKEVEIFEVGDVDASVVEDTDVLALGCPAMGSEVLEESEMEPFMESIDDKISGKKIALFGSYDWGDGGWMRDWEERIGTDNAQLVGEKGVTCMEEPSYDILSECEELGSRLAALI